jgi:predicted CoA-binding protein
MRIDLMNVAVIGASDKPERFSYQAVSLLKEKGHQVFPVHQRLKTIDGLGVYTSIKDIPQPIDTVTLYVAADISSGIAADILAVKPKRLIFNPGAENPQLLAQAHSQGILTTENCTLVMLRSGQF